MPVFRSQWPYPIEDPPVELSLEHAAMGRQLVAVSDVELSALTVTAVRIARIGLAATRSAHPATARRQDDDGHQKPNLSHPYQIQPAPVSAKAWHIRPNGRALVK